MTSPSLRLIASTNVRPLGPSDVKSVVLIGDYPPRRCGIATFTADVREALASARPDLRCEVAALNDHDETYAYPPEVAYEIREDELDDYRDAAARINAAAPDVVCVQHEFGIFGGPAGEHLMTLLDALDAPVVSTLHTILERPNADQRRVFERLIARSSRVIVMAERGRDMLRRTWGVPEEKIVLVPHGAPDTPLLPTDEFKAELGFSGHDLLFTFGLLSPNKGLETAIRAMPAIVAARPNALYVVLGATHPHLLAHEGERYRDSLKALAKELGVGEHVRFVDSYTDTPRLLRYLHAADVYLTPYLNVEQITSGTLSYAAALGKPIVSTPYWHAEELLADGRGVLVPFADAPAIAEAVTSLLSSPERLRAVREHVYRDTRSTVWSRLAERYLEAFSAAVAMDARSRRPAAAQRSAPSLAGVRRMSDSCGMLQHSLFSLPDRRHGYCVDDNARALILMHRWPGAPDDERRALTSIYASFVQHAWNPDAGRFRNFMSYERAWLEPAGSEDSTGRAFWSVAVTAAEAPGADHRLWAQSLLGEVLPHMVRLSSPRTDAFVVLGLAALVQAGRAGSEQREVLADKAAGLAARLRSMRANGHAWFETYLSYDNARLPEALIRGGHALGDRAMVDLGLSALEWLCAEQTSPAGLFRPVPTVDFGRSDGSGGLFDQQPLEAVATVEACQAALEAGGGPRWAAEAERAYAWFYGANDLGASLADAGEGECYDGLTWAGANRNQGAESVLALQMAACSFRALTKAGLARLKTAGDL